MRVCVCVCVLVCICFCNSYRSSYIVANTVTEEIFKKRNSNQN